MDNFVFNDVVHFLHSNNFSGWISFGSGEPFIYPEFIERIKVLMDTLPKAKFRILTNGTSLLSIPNFIKQSERVIIGVTLDGMNKDDLKDLQVGVDPQEVIANFKRIKNQLSRYYLNYTVTSKSLKSLPLFLSFCLEENIPEVYLTELRVWKRFSETLSKYRPSTEELIKIYNEYLPLFKKKNLSLYLSTSKDSKQTGCYLNGSNSLIIDVDGSTTFCSGREESILGNVKDGDLLLKINELGQRLVDNPDNDWCEHCSTHLDENDCFSVSERIYDKPSR